MVYVLSVFIVIFLLAPLTRLYNKQTPPLRGTGMARFISREGQEIGQPFMDFLVVSNIE